jgi:hypothetical protein
LSVLYLELDGEKRGSERFLDKNTYLTTSDMASGQVLIMQIPLILLFSVGGRFFQ